VQSKICALNFHTNQQEELILSSAASAAVTGGSWKLVYPTSRRGVSYQSIYSIAGLQRLTQFPRIFSADKTSAFKEDKLIKKNSE